MSTPPDRHDDRPAPLRERSQSQNNKLGIRIVPYSPPRLESASGDSRAPSQASSRAQASDRNSTSKYDDYGYGLGHGYDDDPGSPAGGSQGSRGSHVSGSHFGGQQRRNEGHASSPGAALSSSSSSSLSLARARDDGVSGAKLPGGSSGQEGPGAQTPIASRSPSEMSDGSTPIPPVQQRQPFASQLPVLQVPGSTSQLHDEPPTSEDASRVDGAGQSNQQPRPLSRRRNFVAVHADKTFSLVRRGPQSDASATASLRSPPLSYSSRTTISHDGPSIDAWSEDRPSSALSAGTTGTTPVPYTPSPKASPPLPSPSHEAEDTILATTFTPSASPWNYRLVGGLRKVPSEPDAKGKKPLVAASSSVAEPPLAPLPEFSVYRDEDEDDDGSTRRLVAKASFASAQTASTTSETTNYKVYGHSSSPADLSTESLVIPSSSSPTRPNYEILGQSSPAAPVSSYHFSSSPPGTADSDQNFVLHGDPSPFPTPSPSKAPSLALVPSSPPAVQSPPKELELELATRQPRPTYSQESLRVPPLRPSKKKSYEGFGYYKQRSRENLRARAGSVKSINTISSIISSEAAQAFFAYPVVINVGAQSARPAQEGGGAGGAGSSSRSQQQQTLPHRQQQLLEKDPSSPASPWSTSQAAGSSTLSPLNQNPVQQRSSAPAPVPIPMIPANRPHQWSSQLSTVMSESEGGSEPGPSRSVSPLSGPESHRRRSSAGWGGSMHSRQLQSMSSSLAAQLEESPGIGSSSDLSRLQSHSRSDSLDRPQPTYGRGGPSGTAMEIRDHDEHGDGLADLQETSRSGLSGFFSSSSSSRGLHSSGSSRANSFNSASIPAWAKVYYGSGERRFLGAPSISTLSDDSRPTSSVFQGSNASPNTDHFPLSIYSPRKRAREVNPSPGQRPFSDSASMDITPAPPLHGQYLHPDQAQEQEPFGVLRTIRRKTSSIWSPHLGMDRRATRYSIWEPPSVSWSADSGILGKRNAQVIFFIAGFIFPFAWMIAALLPLPPNPQLQMLERGDNSSRSQLGRSVADLHPAFRIDESRFESARWWRNLNRVMSVVGLIIIGVVVALAIVGTRQGWMLRSN